MKDEHAIALITDALFLSHDTGGGEHPETPERLTALWGRLEGGPLGERLRRVRPRAADWPLVCEAHDRNYLLRFEEAALSGKPYIDHPDNRISYDTYGAALLAAGAGPTAIDLLESGGGGLPFCALRPPGHHAEASRAMGFCFINNTVVAARYWQKVHGRRRILIVDWDAHHGNGIQHAFEEDPDVFYASLHEHPTFSFPGTGHAGEKGRGAGLGATMNIPLMPGAGDGEVLSALRVHVEPALARFRPEAIIIAAGFDGHELDDMSGLACSTGLYAELGRKAALWAERFCEGRVLTLLEGGYHLEALADSAERYLEGLTGRP